MNTAQTLRKYNELRQGHPPGSRHPIRLDRLLKNYRRLLHACNTQKRINRLINALDFALRQQAQRMNNITIAEDNNAELTEKDFPIIIDTENLSKYTKNNQHPL